MKGIWKYSSMLPQIEENFKVTLGEGNTPLIRSRRLGKMLGLDNLFFKLEMVNPSGSYKDRFAACAVSDLFQHKTSFCLATSSGNTGAALAAYCAAVGIKCYISIVDGAPLGKVQQMKIYGAEIMMIKDFGLNKLVTENVMTMLKDVSVTYDTSLLISAYCYSPLGMAGVQTIAYEIAEGLTDKLETHVFSPAGGGGLTLALTKGFHTWKNYYPHFKIPKVHCVQPEGNNTISASLRNGLVKAKAVAQSTTSVSGLQVPSVLDGDAVVAACRASGGNGYSVSDELIFECQDNMANMDGIFCEPAGAVGLAGLITAIENQEIDKKDQVICLVTGNGFKDPASAEKISKKYRSHYFKSSMATFQYIESQIQNNKKNFK